MRKSLILLVLALVAFFCQSCFSTRTTVGDYHVTKKSSKAESYTYAKGKQVYLFWGLAPLGRTRVAVPPTGNCEIRTYFNFWDVLLSGITGGLFSMQTIKVKALYENRYSSSQPSGGASVPASAPATQGQ